MRYFILLICAFGNIGVVFSATHHPSAFLEQIKHTADEGEQIVKQFCASCHAEKPLIPLGAPRPKVSQDWLPRVAQGQALLLQHANEGLRGMPPRGGCFECTDEQLMLAIAALLPKASIQHQHENDK